MGTTFIIIWWLEEPINLYVELLLRETVDGDYLEWRRVRCFSGVLAGEKEDGEVENDEDWLDRPWGTNEAGLRMRCPVG